MLRGKVGWLESAFRGLGAKLDRVKTVVKSDKQINLINDFHCVLGFPVDVIRRELAPLRFLSSNNRYFH